MTLAEIERHWILSTLRATGGNKSHAARMLDIDRRTLYRKIAEYVRAGHITQAEIDAMEGPT